MAEAPREALVSRNPATTKQSDRHTDRQTHRHTTTANTALSIASRGKNEVSMLTHYEDMNGDEKCKNWGGLGG